MNALSATLERLSKKIEAWNHSDNVPSHPISKHTKILEVLKYNLQTPKMPDLVGQWAI